MRRGRLLIAAIVAVISLISYYSLRQENPFTHEVQHISMDPEQEIALGLQMAPQMAQEMGGEDDDATIRRVVEQIGSRVVAQGGALQTPYQFQFHALADPQTVNAFALPGGQIFVTHGSQPLASLPPCEQGEWVHVGAGHAPQSAAHDWHVSFAEHCVFELHPR